MSELVRSDVEDWSLQAIVRGSSGDLAKMNLDTEMNGEDLFLDFSAADACSSHGDHHELFSSSPEIFNIPTELEELYKPFYNTASHSFPAQAVLEFQTQRNTSGLARDPKPAQSDVSSDNSTVARAAAGYTPKYRKRKNQPKRVVIQVSAEDLSSDKWAWRKYGQKPIKGSPYPRSYYRCSSSKGCLARKQVEQSCTDPGLLIVTYTAEHSHSQPIRRNSLAGTVRQKSQSHNNTKTVVPEKTEESCYPVSIDQVNRDESPRARIVKEENKTENEARVIKRENHDDGIYNDFVMPDFVIDDDFFSGFEDFADELICQIL
ncbi:WRKY transcription factor [Orobanche gracilis]